MSRILITGGAGYIGSHTAVQTLNAGHDVVILDSLVNSSQVAVERIKELTGRELTFIEVMCVTAPCLIASSVNITSWRGSDLFKTQKSQTT